MPSNVNNKGFVYEEYIFELLKDQNLVPAGFTPAGADNSAPDCKFLWGVSHITWKLNLMRKQTTGKSGLKYNVSTKKWFLDGKNTIQDRTMRQNLKDLGVEGFVKVLGMPGEHLEFLDFLRKKQKNEKTTWGDKEYDYKTFPDKYIPIDTNTLSNLQL